MMRNYFPANEEDGINLLFISQFVDVWPLLVNKNLKNKLETVLELSEGHIRWCQDRDVYTKAGQEVLNHILKKQEYIKKLKTGVKESSDKMTIFARKIQNLNVLKVSDEELVEIIEKHNGLFLKMISYGMPPAIMELNNDLLTNYLNILLGKKLAAIRPRKTMAEYFQILTDEIDNKGAVRQERIDRLKIAIAARTKNSTKLIQKHAQKYFWLNYGYEGPILKNQYFIKEIKKDIQKKEAKKELSKLLKEGALIKKMRKIAERELRLDQEEKRLFAASRDTVFTKLYRKDALIFSLAVLEKVLKEISRRTGYSLKQIRHCLPGEIKLLFQKQISKNELNQRIKHLVYYFKNKKPIIITGPRARRLIKKILMEDKVGEVKFLQGIVACQGKAQGVVKLINTFRDMAKMKSGDILVSIATIPEIVPAMKKAGAILTDIGGLTSHAAIVSRELGVPCVISTKIATKVLKDGDLVEVDANKGVVKKLK